MFSYFADRFVCDQQPRSEASVSGAHRGNYGYVDASMTTRVLIDEDVGRAEVVNRPSIGIPKACHLGVELCVEPSGYGNLTKTGSDHLVAGMY